MHIGPLIFGTSVVVFIFLLQFIFKQLGELVGKGLSYGIIAEFIALNLAWMLVLAVPMGVLFATLMAYGKLSGSNELTIIKSAGGSAIRTMIPAILGGLCLYALLFYFNDNVLPETNHRAYVMMTDIKQFRPTAIIEKGRFSQLEGYSILARDVTDDGNRLEEVTIYSKQGPYLNVINAERADLTFSDDLSRILMTLRNGEVQRVNKADAGEFRRFNFREYQLTLASRAQRFEQSDPTAFGRTDRTMNIAQMQRMVDSALARQGRALTEFRQAADPDNEASDPAGAMRVKTTRREAALNAKADLSRIRPAVTRLGMEIDQRSRDANRYLVEIHKKQAIPAACLIFVFVGAPLGIVVRRGNFGASATIALGFFIIYWSCLVAGEKLADRNVLHPELAMWLGNIILGTIGLYLTVLVSRETVMPRLNLRRFFRRTKSSNANQFSSG